MENTYHFGDVNKMVYTLPDYRKISGVVFYSQVVKSVNTW